MLRDCVASSKSSKRDQAKKENESSVLKCIVERIGFRDDDVCYMNFEGSSVFGASHRKSLKTFERLRVMRNVNGTNDL